ncbi:sulfated surface glycoprotein 185-like [Setaria italica]|uniref:sulfated surface glycoprotein 185-like n=1 Tax=Setaria italica TaxID=4555 RepID=UPI000351149F|nr:sulfated surface glycoprotein 185-like [Setaria italica]
MSSVATVTPVTANLCPDDTGAAAPHFAAARVLPATCLLPNDMSPASSTTRPCTDAPIAANLRPNDTSTATLTSPPRPPRRPLPPQRYATGLLPDPAAGARPATPPPPPSTTPPPPPTSPPRLSSSSTHWPRVLPDPATAGASSAPPRARVAGRGLMSSLLM